MYSLKSQDQGLIILSQQDYLPILVESFLIDADPNRYRQISLNSPRRIILEGYMFVSVLCGPCLSIAC